MKWCPSCLQTKHKEEFGADRKGTGGKHTYCKKCVSERIKKRKKEFSNRVSQIKLDAGCTDCGYNKHAGALHFDHLPGFKKVNNVARLTVDSSWVNIEREIAKCEVVCANCHAIRTYERRKDKEEQK